VPEERADLFIAFDICSTEMEFLNFLYATALMLKPNRILEAGCYHGIGTMALAAACRHNGIGHVVSIDIDDKAIEITRTRLMRCGLSGRVDLVHADCAEYLRGVTEPFQMAFFDSGVERPDEFELCHERGLLAGPSFFHDTSPYLPSVAEIPDKEPYRQMQERLKRYTAASGYSIMEVGLSRGLTCCWPAKYP
jgi:hypothetical protein